MRFTEDDCKVLNKIVENTTIDELLEEANIQAGYMFRSLWSIDARYTHIEADKYSYLNNDLYFNRPDFADLSLTRYLTRSYASKIQLTIGWTHTKGQCRTPDSKYHEGSEWNAIMMYQFKF